MDIAVDVFKIIDAVLKNTQNDCPLCDNSADIVVNNDICYNSCCPKDCLLDTFMLKNYNEGAAKPALLYIHGGGFVAGDKKYRAGISSWLACSGVTVFNINYGLCPDYKFPEPLAHLVLALNYIKNYAQNFNLDLSKIIVAGDSAGAYYAAMLACACNSGKLTKIMSEFPTAKISAAILICGAYDLDEMFKLHFPLGIDKKLFSDFTGFSDKNYTDYELYDMVSPTSFIDSNFPPSFLIYSKKDVFCRGQSEKLIQELNQNNVHNEHYSSTRLLANHCFSLNWKDKDAIKANAALLDFVNRFTSNQILPIHHHKKKVLLDNITKNTIITTGETPKNENY